MKTYALDTNCFVNAVNPASPSFDDLQDILRAAESGRVCLKVSIHTLHELEIRKDGAWELAKTLPELPHCPIGSWDDQIGTWDQDTGTWDDARRNDQIQVELEKLAKSGTSIRDRGGYVDALCNALDGFVTSDKQLVKSGPAGKINRRFATKVLAPEQLAAQLRL